MTIKQSIKNDFTKMNFSRRDIRYVFAVVFSSFVYSFGMNTFVSSGNLFPSGFAGISRLLSLLLDTYLHISIGFGVIYFTINIMITIFVWNKIGHKFILYSVLWFSMTSIFTDFMNLPVITHEPLLIAVFGGLINGFAIGTALQNNASSGGTDFIAIWMSMKYNKNTWNYVLGANVVVLLIAGSVYGWNTALYSIIFQYVSTQVVSTMHKRYKLTSLHVVTDHPEEVSSAIFKICRHGITKMRCEGAYTDEEHWLLMTTINSYQLRMVIECIKCHDPKCFITVSPTDRIIGNYFQNPLD